MKTMNEGATKDESSYSKLSNATRVSRNHITLRSRTSRRLPRMPHTPQFALTITLGSKSATSHFSLPNAFSPGVITQSNSPATPRALDIDLTSRSTSVGENPVTNIGHLVANKSGRTGPHSVSDSICNKGSLVTSEIEVGDGKPKPGENMKKRSVYGSNVSWNCACTSW